MILEECADLFGIFTRARHPQFNRFQAAQQHPRGVGIADRAHRVAQHPHRVHPVLRSRKPTRDQIGMPADVLGERIDDDVRTVLQRMLPQRAEECVVDCDRRRGRGVREHRVTRGSHSFDIDQRIGRIGGAFEIDHRHFATLRAGEHLGAFERVRDLGRLGARRKINVTDTKARQRFGDEPFGCRVKRARVQDHVAFGAERQQQRGNGGHARRKHQRVFGAVPHRQPVLEDFLVGTIETRIDQPVGAIALSPRTLAGDRFEVALAIGGAAERKRGRQEDRWLERAFGQHRIIPQPHHQRRRLERAPTQCGHGRLGHAARRDRICHGRGHLVRGKAWPAHQ